MKKGIIQLKDKTNIFYKELGHGDNLFLLHGNGGNSSYFEYNLGCLSKYFHLYLIDYRDHGKSGNSRDVLSFDLLASDLKEVYDKLNISKAHLLGFSDGANLALVFTLKYPDLVDRLILNAPNTRYDGTRFISKVISNIENIFRNILPFFKRNKRVAALLLNDLKVNREDLNNIDKKVLILVGSRDLIRLEHVKNIARNIDGSKLIIIKNIGHKFARIKPGLFNKLVIEFIKEE